jgi:hypothetical protein
MNLVSDIKLIRTDTTLDLSQKAEKGILALSSNSLLIPAPVFAPHQCLQYLSCGKCYGA